MLAHGIHGVVSELTRQHLVESSDPLSPDLSEQDPARSTALPTSQSRSACAASPAELGQPSGRRGRGDRRSPRRPRRSRRRSARASSARCRDSARAGPAMSVARRRCLRGGCRAARRTAGRRRPWPIAPPRLQRIDQLFVGRRDGGTAGLARRLAPRRRIRLYGRGTVELVEESGSTAGFGDEVRRGVGPRRARRGRCAVPPRRRRRGGAASARRARRARRRTATPSPSPGARSRG